ncbi:MAG: alcohol dehydrogenase catalytic domain-containing protein [Phycisphaerales bacterium]
MRAVRSDGQSIRVVHDAPDPALGACDALVHPTRVLVSPADAASKWAGVVGHQFVGVVKKLNIPSDAPALVAARASLLNKRVVGTPQIVCTNCDMCRAGLPAHCRARRVMGLSAREGCFADLFSIPVSNLVEVPATIEDDRAVFAHLAAGAVQACHMLRAASKAYITVIGDSPLALITAQALARQNKSTRLLHARPECARFCERWAIKSRAIEEPGRRQDQDVVIDCTGTAAGLRLALQFVRPRGVVLLKSPFVGAPFPPGQPFADDSGGGWADGVDLTPAIVNEVQLLGCRDASVADGLGALADLGLDVLPLITKRLKLDDAPAAFAAARSREHFAVMMDL